MNRHFPAAIKAEITRLASIKIFFKDENDRDSAFKKAINIGLKNVEKEQEKRCEIEIKIFRNRADDNEVSKELKTIFKTYKSHKWRKQNTLQIHLDEIEGNEVIETGQVKFNGKVLKVKRAFNKYKIQCRKCWKYGHIKYICKDDFLHVIFAEKKNILICHANFLKDA